MKCKVMGIVNVTPDSFSDGGKYFAPEEALRRIKNIVDDGADIIDIGAESTRPGCERISWEEEWSRLERVLDGLFRQVRPSVPVSIDTYHPETAERALAAGVSIVNCVYPGPVPEMLRLCTARGAKIIVPASEAEAAAASGVPFWIDPMVGFGTSREEDLELLRSVPELAKKGPVLVGASRKRIVKKLTGEKMLGKNVGGNVAIAIWCAMKGASAVRVHDVKETVQAVKVVETLAG